MYVSARVLELTFYIFSGFQHEGRIREGVWKEGKFVDKLQMGLLAREYSERQVPDGSVSSK